MNKKIVSIALISIFLLAIAPSIVFAEDKSYTIDKADIQLFVQSDGLLHVKESLFYSFDGEWNGVYRDIPLKEGQSIKNIKVTTKGAYSSYEIITEGDIKKIKVYLYSDPEKTKKISDRDVEVIIEYDFVNAINIYNDVGELHYKIWGEYWDVPVEEVTSTIHFPSSTEDVKYWLNPLSLNVENSTFDSTINLTTGTISPGNYFEIRAAIPLSTFENPVYANKISRNGLAEMEKIQKEYAAEENDSSSNNPISLIIGIIVLFLPVFIPIIIYLIYGREPKIGYYAEYEREPPTNDPPALVNALSGRKFRKNIGDPNIDGFQATIMDLINRKVLSIIPKEADDKSLKIKINKEIIPEKNLTKFELDLIEFLNKFEKNNVVDLKQLIRNLGSRYFQRFFKSWQTNFKNQFLNKDTFKKFFVNTGSTLMRAYGIIAIVSTFILPMLFFILIPVGIVCLFLPSGVGGRWTEYGKEYDDKWQNFKKYLNDFSLMKEHPPESVAVWNDYLVYATALGVADKVKEAMAMHLPTESLDQNHAYSYHRHGGYALMSSALQRAMRDGGKSGYSGGRGSGRVGGGSGGGGGGAF